MNLNFCANYAMEYVVFCRNFHRWKAFSIAPKKESPFLKCVVSMWALPVRGVGKGLPGWFGALFSHVALGRKGLPGWFGALFSMFARLTEGRGGQKLFGQFSYRANTFQKGASLTQSKF